MKNRLNMRTVIMIFILIIIIVILIVNNIKSNTPTEEAFEMPEYIEYLDNGIQFLDFYENDIYLENIIITDISFDNNMIEYTLKNNSENSVYIYNEIKIKILENTISLTDDIQEKIELKSSEEKRIKINMTLNQLGNLTGDRVEATDIDLILKPIYVKYDDKELLGIVKGNNM